MPSRNVNSSVQLLPTSHLPRTKHKIPFFKHYTSAAHGFVFPFFIKEVAPNSTWSLKCVEEILKENSIRVPLDEIYHDTYFFYVPYRIIFPDWKKVLGDKDDPLDTNVYSVPSFTYRPNAVTDSGSFVLNDFSDTWDPTTFQLPWFMGYSALQGDPVDPMVVQNKLSCLPIWAYWKIINFYFRDENLESWMDYETLLPDGSVVNGFDYSNFNNVMNVFQVGKYHDYFSNGTLSPQRGPEVLMHLDNELLPVVGVVGSAGTISANAVVNVVAEGGTVDVGDVNNIKIGSSPSQLSGSRLLASTDGNGISINEFRISMMTQALYERKNMFGTRYDEYHRGVWGEEIPAALIQEPEYLGGERHDLSQIPVFGTGENNLAIPSGHSSTGALGGSFFKTFLEYGYVIGLHVFRVKHTYGQGLDPLWQHFDELDFYNPIFANMGFQPRYKKEIANTGELDINSTYNIPEGDLIWNYNEAWIGERIYNSQFTGLFNPLIPYHNDICSRYGYLDIYAYIPTYSKRWLKEPMENVIRTLSGQIIPNSTSMLYASIEDDLLQRLPHQYLVRFGFDIEKTMVLPAHSVPVTLLGRL